MKISRQLLAAFCMAAVVLASWLSPLDAPATERVDAGLKKALVSFAAARALTGVVAVIQGTTFSAQPLGIGLTLSPGQILTPFHELLRHFSDFMLAAAVAFSIQKFLIAIGSYWGVSAVLTAIAVAWALAHTRQAPAPGWLSKALIVMLMLRFALPVVTLGTDRIWQTFLANDYSASQKAIENAASETGKLDPGVAAPAEPPGFMDRLKALGAKGTDLQAGVRAIGQTAERATLHVVQLIAVFLLQVLVFPVLMLWAMYAILRALVRTRSSP